ncbi:MAG: UvrD-helicase domain-containing protein [Synergistaceae bacterium]|nr:UvrD-helicase domain-containing protein [Synergistaceae bacterium]
MTGEEQQQVQNIINARTKLLTEKISRQEEKINALNNQITSLNDELEAREHEINELKIQLEEAQEQNTKLVEFFQTQNSAQAQALALTLTQQEDTQPEPVKPRQVNYLVSLLRAHFGLDSFKPGQEEVINALLSGRDVFCSMPPGYGKSICYRLPALLMPGLTLVITPSEPDNVSDVHSGCLNSSLTPTQKRDLLRRIRGGACKILYAAMTSLSEPDMIDFLNSIELSMTAIILHWGEPNDLENYREFASSLKAARIPTVVFADSTSPELRQDILKFTELRSPLRIITGFNRPNLEFRIIKTENKLFELRELITQKRDIAGIIYSARPELLITFADEKLRILKHSPKPEGYSAKFVIFYDFPETLADLSQEMTDAGQEVIVFASRADLNNADRNFARLCSDDPRNVLSKYLGEDETLAINNQDSKPERGTQGKITGDEVADFDFRTANEAQKEAITSSSGPLLILAGPGTGKTYTLIQRTIFMIQKKHIKPENILIATFTNKAAVEIKSRLTEEFAARKIFADVNDLLTGTFHSICEKILRDYVQFTRFKKNFAVLDHFSHAHLIMRNIDSFGNLNFLTSQGKWKRAGELCSYVNSLSEELVDPEELIKDPDYFVASLGQAVKVHDGLMVSNNSLSFSTLLVETYKLLRDNPEILSDIQGKITHVMADEYQDTNYIQEQILFLLAGDRKNICAAGDDDQSLYRFRGAAVQNILEFPDKFGKNECKIVKLILNYRSCPGIVSFFNDWIVSTGNYFSWGAFRHEKKLEAFRQYDNKSVFRLAGVNDPEEWHEKILTLINTLKDSGRLKDYNQIAFLFRSVKSERVQALSQFLENHNISVYSPRSDMFFKRGEIHFALGCLILLFPKYHEAITSGAFNFNGTEPGYITYYKTCLKYVKRFIDKPDYAKLKKWLQEKRKFHAELNGPAGYKYSDLLYNLFAFTPFTKALDADIRDSAKVLRPVRNLAGLVQAVKSFEFAYKIMSINSKYMDYTTTGLFNVYLHFMLDDGMNEYESEENFTPSGHVAFMTIHQAKGREFPVVFVDSLESVPFVPLYNHGNAVMSQVSMNYYKRPPFEPESGIKYFDFWRLFYVAFSRAKDLLILTCSEDSKTPSEYFEAAYNKLDDADDNLDPEKITLSDYGNSGAKKIYSFSDIMLYVSCPLKYKFIHELGFTAGSTKYGFMGSLVHAVIEDIHRAVISHQESKINEQNISDWIESEYANLSPREKVILTKADFDTVKSHVMRYIILRGNDWGDILRTEAELKLVREDYILEGRTDLISLRDGKTEIIDFKTGRKPNINITGDRSRLETHKNQINIYAYMLGKTTGQRVSKVKLYYTGELTSSPEIVYDYDKSEAEKIIMQFDSSVRKIISQDFTERSGNHETCRECDFRYYCGRI